MLFGFGCAAPNPARSPGQDSRLGGTALLNTDRRHERMALSRTRSSEYRERHRAPVVYGQRSPSSLDSLNGAAGAAMVLAAIFSSMAGA